MSSTGRGSEREEEDQYFTRYPVALGICEALKGYGFEAPRRILEPSAGTGAFVSAAAEVWQPDTLLWNDINTSLILPEHLSRASGLGGGRLISLESDFLLMPSQADCDLVIGNPPYSDAEAHVRKAITMIHDEGAVAFLLRVNFLAGIARTAGLWAEHPPDFVCPLDKRPQFVDGYRINKKGKKVKKGTDSCEYAVFIWRKERPECEPAIRWIQWSKYLKKLENKVARVEVTPKVAGKPKVDKAKKLVAGSAIEGAVT